MKKTIIALALFALPFFGIAQSKFSIESTFGLLNLGKDSGENYELGVNYHFSENTALKLSGLSGNLNNKNSDIDYSLIKFSLHAEQSVATVKNIKLSFLFGFSYFSIDDDLPLDKNEFTGLDMGFNVDFYPDSDWGIGLKVVNTYAYKAPGGFRQANVFLKYSF
uniref:hypothetical protein n=1 Tax=Flavobacterium sp. TaxID=239 RepID=UPI00404B393B